MAEDRGAYFELGRPVAGLGASMVNPPAHSILAESMVGEVDLQLIFCTSQQTVLLTFKIMNKYEFSDISRQRKYNLGTILL